jgi:glycosyltransferase involved in cell wall biosynthesis
MPLVSVIIPFRNRISWLSEAIQSVLDQTYTDFELIVVDDGSDEEIAPEMIADSRIVYVRQENKGASAARNHGIDLATGKYIAFLDADDLFLPAKLEKQVGYMEAHPKVLFTHTSYRRMSATGEDLEIMHPGRFSGRISRELFFGCGIATPTVMIARHALGESLRFNESVHVGQGEDIILWLLFATKSEIIGLDEPLTRVRMHGTNVSLNPESQMACRQNIVKYVIDENREFDSALPGWSRSSLFLDLAHWYLKADDRKNFYKYLKRALIAWPANPFVLYSVCRVAGYKLVGEIRRLKNSRA